MGTLAKQDWVIYLGATARWTLTVLDADDEREDLTGGTLYLQVRTAVDAADPPALSLETNAGILHELQEDATLGQASVTFTAAQTAGLAAGLYFYDVFYDDAAGDRWTVVPTSKLSVRDPVTVPA